MKVGIAGFSSCGKSTVFEWLTGVKPDPSRSQHGQIGIAEIPDERLDWLSAHFKPKKHTPPSWSFSILPVYWRASAATIRAGSASFAMPMDC